MNGFEGMLISFVNKYLPSSEAKEPLLKILPWAMIAMNSMAVVFLLREAVKDFAVYAQFYVIRMALAVLMIAGGFLMKKLSLAGWRMAFYALLVSLFINLLSLSILSILAIILHCFFVYSFIHVRECFGKISAEESNNANP